MSEDKKVMMTIIQPGISYSIEFLVLKNPTGFPNNINQYTSTRRKGLFVTKDVDQRIIYIWHFIGSIPREKSRHHDDPHLYWWRFCMWNRP